MSVEEMVPPQLISSYQDVLNVELDGVPRYVAVVPPSRYNRSLTSKT